MEKTELIEKKALMTEKVRDADVVLAGIGGEWNEDFAEIEKYPVLSAALQEIDADSSLEWIVPYLEQIYIQEHTKGERIQAYQKLYQLVKDKNYFIVTTCIDSIIEKAGFDKERIVEPCGSYQWLQCSQKCCTKLYSSDKISLHLRKILENHESLSSLQMPLCPECGMPLVFSNILCAHNYVQEGIQEQWERYTKWLQHTLNKKLCILELGVGMELPNIIRWPFEKIAYYNRKANFFRVHSILYQLTEELGSKGNGDLGISAEGIAVSVAMKSFEFLALERN